MLNVENLETPSYLLGFETFKEYVSFKAHFNTPAYNYKKRDKKIQHISVEAFQKRNDKQFFAILESSYQPHEIKQIFLANFVYNRYLWIGELLAENCISIWHEWKGKLSRMDYQFTEDMRGALTEIKKRKSLDGKSALKFLVEKPKHSHPLILKFLWGGMLQVETYLLISSVMSLRKVYEPFLFDDKLWNDFEHKVQKYEHFLKPKINKEKIKRTLIEITME